MAKGCISIDRILAKLDEHLHKNDYGAAERHLTYWLTEAVANQDSRTELLVRNELMGLYRKLGREREALGCANDALETVERMGISHQVGAATTYLNAATVYKAFGMADRALPLFEHAKAVYERELEPTDSRLGGLYNNMALALVDLGRYSEADALYRAAITVMQSTESGAPEVAITYLNMASAAEAELGLEGAAERIADCAEHAEALLEGYQKRDGYYAFVCEKCATVFDYYGYFFYAKELKARAKEIYGNART